MSQTGSYAYDELVIFNHGLMDDNCALDSAVKRVQERENLRDEYLMPDFLCYGSLV